MILRLLLVVVVVVSLTLEVVVVVVTAQQQHEGGEENPSSTVTTTSAAISGAAAVGTVNSNNIINTSSGGAEQDSTSHTTLPVVDDRSWLDLFGEVAKDYLTHQVIPPTDEHCRWDWRVARCEPYCHCTFRSEWGDYHLGRSCRKRRFPEDEQVCSGPTTTQFDPVRLLEYAEEAASQAKSEGEQPEPNQSPSGGGGPAAYQQILFQTVKALQWSRDKAQKWYFARKEQALQKLEQLQDDTCAPLMPTDGGGGICLSPSNMTWKEKILCREALCDEEPPEGKDNNKAWKDKLLFWKQQRPKPNQETSSSSFLTDWSAASAHDWSAGVATQEDTLKRKRKRRPRVSPKRTTATAAIGTTSSGFGGMPIHQSSQEGDDDDATITAEDSETNEGSTSTTTESSSSAPQTHQETQDDEMRMMTEYNDDGTTTTTTKEREEEEQKGEEEKQYQEEEANDEKKGGRSSTWSLLGR